MKALFLIFHGFDPSNGISKKISYQLNALKACGLEAHICFMDENGSKRRLVDDHVIIDYGNGTWSKIQKRIEFSSIVRYARENHIDIVYIRSNHNANLFTIRMVRQMKKAGMKVVMEIPTYPYDDEYVNKSMQRQLIQDKLFRNRLASHLDAIVTFSEEDYIFGQQTIRISNGIDFDSVSMKAAWGDTSRELNLIGVAEIHRWHGFDRLISGLAAYYSKPRDYKVFFHIVGYFFSPIEEQEITGIIRDHHLEPYVILYGKKHGQELDAIFDKCDFGVGSLGRHRVGIDHIKTLKNREYAARGIPFIYSESDSDFDDKPYVLKMPADETPVDIEQIIQFHRNMTMTPQQIRDSISDLSWKHQMQNVLNAVYPTPGNGRRLAYCIPSLNHSGGMERVLTNKANYLADVLGYDVSIITTDNKNEKPYFPLSPKVRVLALDVNIDSLWKLPAWKRLYLYHTRMKAYKEKMQKCLLRLKPDVTISLLRREINFLCDLKDGSKKVGEIHFGRYRYREAHFTFLPAFANRWLTRWWMGQLDRKVRRLDRFVVLTHEDADNWHTDNLRVIPNPIPDYNGPLAECSAKRVIAAGRYTWQKGFDLLIGAWVQIGRRHPDWTLHIFGGGDNAAYQQMADDKGLQGKVVCHPVVSDIRQEYLKSSVFVFSSRFEGFGLALAEAMSVGVPPVSFACPCGPSDIIRDGEDGFLCKDGDCSQLADAICRLIENDELRKSMGQKAAQNIRRFTTDNIMRQWNELFNEITKRP